LAGVYGGGAYWQGHMLFSEKPHSARAIATFAKQGKPSVKARGAAFPSGA
jgi:hypothetical protein